MAFCSKCGSELREGVKFCTKCGTKVLYNVETDDGNPIPQSDGGNSFNDSSESDFNFDSAENSENAESAEHSEAKENFNASQASFNQEQEKKTDDRPLAPTIMIAPPKVRTKQSIAKGIVKTVVGCILVIALIIGGVWTTAWVMSNPFRSSPVEEVDNEKYTRMLALVEDVRNPNFDEVIDDLLTQKGKAEDYSFLKEYTDKFNEILGEKYTEQEKLFCDCCYFVWYTEYQAKRYEWLSENSGLLNSLYTGKANSYRDYADTLYDMLCNADSVTDMNNIKIYCADHEIISDSNSKK